MDQQFEDLVQYVISFVKKRVLSEVDTPELLRKDIAPQDLLRELPISLRNKKQNTAAIKEILERIIDASVLTNHPYFMNQMFGKTQPIAFIADILIAMLNTSMYTYEVAPALSLIEKEVITQLGAKIWGKDTGDGVFTAGGSMSNMNALFLARQHLVSQAKQKGLCNEKPLAIFVSEQAHYSFTKGVNFLGFGLDALIKIPSTSNARIDIEALQKAILESKAQGRVPMMLIGIAGTTVSGSFDDLESLARIAKEHKMWFHVDAAYGGSLLFSETYNSRLKGINQADSVTWNFHKVMGMTLSTASFLTREKGLLNKAFNVQAGYLFHQDDYDYDLGQKSLQGGRRPDAFKLWLTWKYLGTNGLQQHVEKLCKAAETMAQLVRKTSHLELFAPPEASIVCFRYVNPSMTDKNENLLNKKIRDTLFLEGKIIFNYAELNQKIYLRCVLLDPMFTAKQLQHIIERVCTIGKQLSPDTEL